MSLGGSRRFTDEDSDDEDNVSIPSKILKGIGNVISKLNVFLPPLRKPSVHPLSAGAWVGAITAFALGSQPWLVLLSWAGAAMVGTLATFKIRDYVYNRRMDPAKTESERHADKLGRKAGNSYVSYAKSFFSLDAYRHPLRFGSKMHQVMHQTPISTRPENTGLSFKRRPQ